MTVILGLHLSEKIYLVSDTRVTITKPNGEIEYKDDFIKSCQIGGKAGVITAGSAGFASFFINYIKMLISEDDGISEVRTAIEENLERIIKEYVDYSGVFVSNIAMIFAGFDDGNGKKIDASFLGDAMSGTPKAMKKNGIKSFKQSIPKEITSALLRKIMESNEPPGKGDYIEVPYRKSHVFSLKIEIDTRKYPENGYNFIFQDIECYRYSVFHPSRGFEDVVVPDELMSTIEFRERDENFSDTIFYEDSSYIMSFINQLVKRNANMTVGGHIFTTLITPEGLLFPTGDLAGIVDGEIVNFGGIFVENGAIGYKLKNGDSGLYREIENFESITGSSLDL